MGLKEESPTVVGSGCTEVDDVRKALAKLRCLKECVECLRDMQPLPKSLCYVPAEVEYKLTKNAVVSVYTSPSENQTILTHISCTTKHSLVVSGEDVLTSRGHWGRLLKVMSEDQEVTGNTRAINGWILLKANLCATEGLRIKKEKSSYLTMWQEVVEHEYSLCSGTVCKVLPADDAAVERLRLIPSGWTKCNYEHLAQLLVSKTTLDIGDIVSSVQVSSHCDAVDNLTDGNIDTYWQPEENLHRGPAYILLNIKPNVFPRKVMLTVKREDADFIPGYLITKVGADESSLEDVGEKHPLPCSFDPNGISDFVVLNESNRYEDCRCIKIEILEAQRGSHVRIRGIKIIADKTTKEVNLKYDLFEKAAAEIQLHKLEEFDHETLYRRSVIMLRLMELVDCTLPFIVPCWEFSMASPTILEVFRAFMPLSKLRDDLLENILQKSLSTDPFRSPDVSIDRKAAREHCNDPDQDPLCRNAIFNQLYHCLQGQKLNYRWKADLQWWRCSFIGESASDAGGLFRESITAMAEELCPCSSLDAVPLPFFIRTPNQTNVDATICRDFYIPNPSCTQYHKFEWIGKLMGACFRGTEKLIVHLPPICWKRICGRAVSWSHDFVAVDQTQVTVLENMEHMSEENFMMCYGDELMWTTTQSDGTVVQLKPSSVNPVTYADRMEYIKLVIEARLNENKSQIEAIQRGLLQVVPQAALEVLTWYEVEKRICGDPDIPVEALRKHITFESCPEYCEKFLWDVLTRFSNIDRSFFLRFVTGRRRLPVNITVSYSENIFENAHPKSATCSSALFIPAYTCVDVMEKQLRYAIYNCLDMDLG